MSYDRNITPTPGLPTKGDMHALIEAIVGLGKPHKNPDSDGAHFTLAPAGWEVKALPTHDQPARPAATAKLRDATSFIRYFNDHKVARSRIYAQLDPARFLAVIDDFDTAEATEASVTDQTDWRGFRAEFSVPPSREWLLWTAANRKHMSQLAFAEFLQDNLPDVIEPEGAALLQMALNFEAAQSGQFIAAQRLQDGSHTLQWKADNNSSGSVKLPEFIKLNIPVFETEQPAEISARLRYRVKDGSLAIWFELVRPHKVLERAFRDTWTRIAEETAGVILLGTPE